MTFSFTIRKSNLRKLKCLGYYYAASRLQSWEQNLVQTSSPKCSRMHQRYAIHSENKFRLLNGSAWGHAQLGSLYVSVHQLMFYRLMK